MQEASIFPSILTLAVHTHWVLTVLSMPMLVLATLLTSIALLASFIISSSIKGYHICILLLEFGMLGVFLAQDWALFYIFWEVTLIPLFFSHRPLGR